MRGIATLIAALALCGCAKDPVSVSQSNNPDIQVEHLFDHDGCQVNRFQDLGRYVYFVTCHEGKHAEAEWSESCGKSCSREVDVQTGRRD